MITRVIAAVLLAMTLTGCGREAATPVVAVASPVAGQFGATERAFVELSIACDDMVLRLLDLGERAAAPALRGLARSVGAARRSELASLHGLLDGAGVTYVNNHAGHDMPGMPTGDELSVLAAAGADFDAMFARLLQAHVEESMAVVRSALRAVTHPATLAAADAMARERAGELDRLEHASPG
jgi:hypothetical protein